MMPFRFFSILILICVLSTSARAQGFSYTGAWSGSIGAQEVLVCFASPRDSQYYYLKHLRGIRLLAKGTGEDDGDASMPEWKEVLMTPQGGKATGIWNLTASADGSLSGAWRDPSSTKELKIKLRKVGELENGSCGTEFYQPIRASALERTKHWKVFSLPYTFKGASRFNAFVQSWLVESAVDDYDCELREGNKREQELVSVTLSEKVLVIKETIFDSYCGGSHNDVGTGYQFFDPQTGEKLDPWQWFKGGERAVNSDTRLGSMIEKLNPAIEGNSGCDSSFSVQAPLPRKGGFEFPIQYIWALRVCDSGVLIPYGKLRPYLTVTGKAVAASLSGRDATAR